MTKRLEDFGRRGPWAVGVRSVEIDDPHRPGRRLPIDVWYPAVDSPGSEPDAEHLLPFVHEAHRDLPPAPGEFPLLLFSHGNSGYRRQSTFLTTHLASWGMVVAAPDHVGNTFPEMAAIVDEDERRRVHLEARRNRPHDMFACTNAVLANEAGWAGVDARRIGALGHSFGGWTSLKLPAIDSRIRAVCGLAPASEPFVGRKAFAPGELPFASEIPVLLVAAIDDVLVDLNSSVRPLFERMRSPASLVGIERADHFHFCDAIPLLHGLHEDTVRPRQTRRASPYEETLQEERSHTLVRALVTAFFDASFSLDLDPTHHFAEASLSAFDAALRALD